MPPVFTRAGTRTNGKGTPENSQESCYSFYSHSLFTGCFCPGTKRFPNGRFLLSGILAYSLATYLFYLEMGMYNALFLVYVIFLSVSSFAFTLMMLSFEPVTLPDRFRRETPVKTTGGFLIFNSITISLMWLGTVDPPLIDESTIPNDVDHHTRLIVLGLELALLLPLSFISGPLFIRKKPFVTCLLLFISYSIQL